MLDNWTYWGRLLDTLGAMLDILGQIAGHTGGMEKIHNWIRYIDDIMFVWEGTEDELKDLMTYLNYNDLNVHLTYSFGRKVTFLDIDISVNEDGTIFTTIFRKPTSTNSLLYAESSHLPSTIRSIPVGQYLRAKRICSTESAFQIQAADLYSRFRERGYGHRPIRYAYKRAQNATRNQLLYTNKDKKPKSDQVRLITTFSGQWNELTKIIHNCWAILLTDPILKRTLAPKPLITAKRSKNLSDLLVRSHYAPKKSTQTNLFGEVQGFSPCKKCKACANTIKSKEFYNSDKTRTFSIRKYLTCTSQGVIYVASCPCNKLYVGMTTRELRIRIREHIRDIEKSKEAKENEQLKTLARHFQAVHNSDASNLRFMAIDQVTLGIRGGNLFRVLSQIEMPLDI
ncbi:unnamed protein product [Ranitomeya imitator]|uniref:Helix-turn-helix domain-containing protein n=1 Tax=Ranitomeya imitator TaxID=111125 RepID=A0ABN9MJ11_9NEOB|nr:unnamed protein product [Ranitomeya imitator]